ncbi:MAG: carboxypeptidase-like regulatory domain-containing protein [Bacteroidetes bacterium]|nr:carboxypeptidase-like regulatory domain-containing protein [Bacteroidota bacterium]
MKVLGTSTGTATDKSGRFALKLENIPVSLLFSCVGYEDEKFRVTKTPGKEFEFLLRSKAYNLKEVNITSTNYSFLFKDRDYSVLDYVYSIS